MGGGGQVVLSPNSTNSAGVGVFFSSRFNPISYTVEEVIKGRFLLIRAQFEKYTVVFINVYAPTRGSDRVAFFSEL